ncbi:Transthyretin-like family protein [Ancylostoma duodenale]|uniref:Transthyretin-like family protein n=1 Tax=Ancylostoma duodenale TaxID=51022 RepID=A0A0C2CYG7_9BILA|nr:Transthyretin-like family protein [Ancylostoma duodenale]
MTMVNMALERLMNLSILLLLAAVSLPYCFAIFGIGSRQSVAVAGRLLCNGITVPGVKVKLYEKEPCYKKFGITIPDNYITSGPYPRRMFNIGTIDLAGRFPGESIDCFN